jgi:carbamoylphosphate synthase small subunit
MYITHSLWLDCNKSVHGQDYVASTKIKAEAVQTTMECHYAEYLADPHFIPQYLKYIFDWPIERPMRLHY